MPQMHGLPSDSLELSVSTGPATATEVFLKESRTKQTLQQQTAIFSEAEKELFDINIKLIEMAQSPALPAGLSSRDFHIEYVRQNAIQNMTIQDALNALTAGVLDKAEVLRCISPSLSREEALEQLLLYVTDAQKLSAEIQDPTAQDEIKQVDPIEEE